MKNFGKYGLALAALFGLLLPACGGGGSANSSTYISVQQFENGNRKFHFLTSPSLEFYATGFLGDQQIKFTEAMTAEVKRLTGAKKTPPSLEPSGGTIVRGLCVAGNGAQANCDFSYAVEGGETGKGYLIANFTDNDMPVGVINALGALLPDQVVQFSGTTNTLVMVDSAQKVLPGPNGLILAVCFDFSSGMARLSLVGAKLEEQEEGGGESDGGGGGETVAPVIEASRPFVALDR